jgi:hypothetical protein
LCDRIIRVVTAFRATGRTTVQKLPTLAQSNDAL